MIHWSLKAIPWWLWRVRPSFNWSTKQRCRLMWRLAVFKFLKIPEIKRKRETFI